MAGIIEITQIEFEYLEVKILNNLKKRITKKFENATTLIEKIQILRAAKVTKTFKNELIKELKKDENDILFYATDRVEVVNHIDYTNNIAGLVDALIIAVKNNELKLLVKILKKDIKLDKEAAQYFREMQAFRSDIESKEYVIARENFHGVNRKIEALNNNLNLILEANKIRLSGTVKSMNEKNKIYNSINFQKEFDRIELQTSLNVDIIMAGIKIKNLKKSQELTNDILEVEKIQEEIDNIKKDIEYQKATRLLTAPNRPRYKADQERGAI